MKKRNDYNSREGSALLFVMIIMVVVSIVGMGQFTNAKLAAIEASRSVQGHQFASLADMGLREFRAIVMNERNRRSFDSLKVVSSGSTPTFSRRNIRDDQNNIIGGYDVFVTAVTAADPEDAHYKITSVAYDENLTQRAQVESYIRLTTVSEDVWGTDDEGGVRFVTGDEIWGSIRSNNPFYISGSPYIDGTTKTAASYNVIDGSNSTSTDSNIFNGGVLFDMPEIPFDATLVTGLADDAAQTINNGSSIEFLADGSYNVTEKNVEMVETGNTLYTYGYYSRRGYGTFTSYNSGYARYYDLISSDAEMGEEVTYETSNYVIDDLGDFGKDSDNIIYVDGSVTVKGEVAGTVSVVASDSIIIDQSIVYASMADDPDPETWGDNQPEIYERLGLYATTKVMATGADYKDIDIHAAIYVSDGNDYSYLRGFCVNDYDTYFGSPDINFYGSIIQNQRGAVGQDGGKGFYKNYWQDARFLTSPPPGSPLSSPEFFGWKSSKLGS